MDEEEKVEDNVEEIDAEPATEPKKNPTFQAVIIDANIDKLCNTLVLCAVYLGFIIAMKKIG